MTNPLSAKSPLSGLTELLSQEMSAKEMRAALAALFRTDPPEALAQDTGFEQLIAQARAGKRQVLLTALASALRARARIGKWASDRQIADQLRLMAAYVDHDPRKLRSLRGANIAYSSAQERARLKQLTGLSIEAQGNARNWQAETEKCFPGKGIGAEKVVLRRSQDTPVLIQKTFLCTAADLEALQDPDCDTRVPIWLVEPYLHISGRLAADSAFYMVPMVRDMFCTDIGRLHVVSDYITGTSLRKKRFTRTKISLAARALADVNSAFLNAPDRWVARMPHAPVTEAPYLDAMTLWWRSPYDPDRTRPVPNNDTLRPDRSLYEGGGAEYYERNDPETAVVIDRLVTALPDIAAAVAGLKKTVCHTDLYTGHMRLVDGRILFLDWGNAAVAPLGLDMGKLLGEIAAHGGKKFSAKKIDRAIATYLAAAPEAGSIADIARLSLLVMLHWHLPRTLALYRAAEANEAPRDVQKYERRLNAYNALTRHLTGLVAGTGRTEDGSGFTPSGIRG